MNIATIGRNGDGQSVVRFLGAKSEAAKELESISVGDDAAGGFLQSRGAQRERLRFVFEGHHINRRFGGSADELRCGDGRFDGIIWIDTPLESIGRIGIDAQPACSAADGRGIEPRALQQHIARLAGDFAFEAADDSSERDGAFRIGDDHGLRIDLSCLAIERLDCLARFSGANDDCCVREFVEIERVQRMAEREHHVVRRVDNVVDRPQPDRFEPASDVNRRSRDLYTATHQSGIAVAHLGGVDADAPLTLPSPGGRGI